MYRRLRLFLLASALVAGLRAGGRSATEQQPISPASLLSGIRFVRRNRPVLGSISLDLFAVLFGGATALLPVLGNDYIHANGYHFVLVPVALNVLLILAAALENKAKTQDGTTIGARTLYDGTSKRPVVDDEDFRNRLLAGCHHDADRRRLRALPLRIGGVLDVAAGVDAALLVEHRGADREARIRRVGHRPHAARGVDQGLVHGGAHRPRPSPRNRLRRAASAAPLRGSRAARRGWARSTAVRPLARVLLAAGRGAALEAAALATAGGGQAHAVGGLRTTWSRSPLGTDILWIEHDPLEARTDYAVTFLTSARDDSDPGNRLAAPLVIRFTTKPPRVPNGNPFIWCCCRPVPGAPSGGSEITMLAGSP